MSILARRTFGWHTLIVKTTLTFNQLVPCLKEKNLYLITENNNFFENVLLLFYYIFIL